MKPSDLAFYLPADQKMLVIYPCRDTGMEWTSIRFRGTSQQFLDSNDDDGVENDVVSIDVENDGDLMIVVCSPMDEEEKTNE